MKLEVGTLLPVNSAAKNQQNFGQQCPYINSTLGHERFLSLDHFKLLRVPSLCDLTGFSLPVARSSPCIMQNYSIYPPLILRYCVILWGPIHSKTLYLPHLYFIEKINVPLKFTHADQYRFLVSSHVSGHDINSRIHSSLWEPF